MNHWLLKEPHPDFSKPNLLIYSSCHTYGILRYLNEHRPEVRRQYNVSAVVIHLAREDARIPALQQFRQPFNDADVIIHHPLEDPKWDGMRGGDIGLKPTCRQFLMESPQASCFWPISTGPKAAEKPVRDLLLHGTSAAEIKRLFDAGQLDCQFAERWELDKTRMRLRDAESDLKAAEFVIAHHREQKMFFTENHPTMPVLGWMTDQALVQLGHESPGEAWHLGLPLKTEDGDNHYPETVYEWSFYGFNYPMNYAHCQGGAAFYHRLVDRIASTATPDTQTTATPASRP